MTTKSDDFGVNLAFVEEMRERFEADPTAVDRSWYRHFNGAGEDDGGGTALVLQERVQRLIEAYRTRGHLCADLDPLDLAPRASSIFELKTFGLDESHLDRTFATEDLPGPESATLRQIREQLSETYCRSIGVELAHIEDPTIRQWLQRRMEATRNHIDLSREEQIRILTLLTDAELFEQFLHTKYVGAKRFSLEGSESLIPLCQLLLETAAARGVEEIVIGMAHRGRLNVLAHILEKDVRQIFAEFDDSEAEAIRYLGRGDVKYHMGFSSNRTTPSGQSVHLSLTFNPSHLAWITAVVVGRVRAKQDRKNDRTRSAILPLVIHGDATFPGQGIIPEVLNLSRLEGYRTGGTVHVVLNNQIGFTTLPQEYTSMRYPTDVARMLRAPIFHVNGEDPEAVAQVIRLATDFRQEFRQDVFIDLFGYRKHGHNEGDEPRFTQPIMYKRIDAQPSVREGYVRRLLEMGKVSQEEVDDIARRRKERLEVAFEESRKPGARLEPSSMEGRWDGFLGGADAKVPEVPTGVDTALLGDLMERLTTVPEGFQVNPKIRRFLQQRGEMGRGERALDWGGAEALAFASLLSEGRSIRLSGQDTVRGTFSHRHASWWDMETGAKYTPFERVRQATARFDVINSPLSEAAVLGFEYGYSLDEPGSLVIWEAQFGDFVNCAQVVIDQYLSSAEDKWCRLSGLVLFLPHGFEGQGPEHSSARLERFLQLCAEDNMIVVNLTTPAQIFHALRRQVLRPYRKPLIVMSPKSLLRHKEATSTLADLSGGQFQRVIADASVEDAAAVERVLLCSGKIYYELAEAREKRGAKNVAIVRLEQFYPMPDAELTAALAPYRDGTRLIWVQEEPWNMGAWFFFARHIPAHIRKRLPLTNVARLESASPATGSLASHRIEQSQLVASAFER